MKKNENENPPKDQLHKSHVKKYVVELNYELLNNSPIILDQKLLENIHTIKS
mgnify:CR=1 FL=1